MNPLHRRGFTELQRRNFGLAVAAVAVIIALIWPITDLIAAHDVGLITGPLRAARLREARETVRTQLLTLGAGLFAAGALVFTALNYKLSGEGQVTDRYTKAIEQLGSDKLDVRIGGIYALERVARDSATDHPTVMEVLAAFIRENSREQWPPPERERDVPSEPVPQRTTRPDVYAAVTVIGRRETGNDGQAIDLARARLPGADLPRAKLGYYPSKYEGFWKNSGANLGEADLSRAFLAAANLTRVNLTRANLTGAVLVGANLADADLLGANLTDANLLGANLTGAILVRANLTGARLSRVNFTGAALHEANLTGARLTDADLTRANLTGANLTGAKYPHEPVPEGWVRDSASLLRRADG